MHILVVDNEPDVITTFVHALESEGHDVSFSTSAEEAITLLRSIRVDVVIVDVTMPAIDGFEFLRRASELDAGITRRAILTSGTRSDATDQFVRRGGVFLEKPFALDELASAVQTASAD